MQFDHKAEEWRQELEAKQQELEDTKQQLMNPTDIEVMRLKLMDEMELNNRKKWEIVHQEIEKYRQSYFAAKRELEFTHGEMERIVIQILWKSNQKRGDYESKLEEMELNQDAELRTMDGQIVMLQQALGNNPLSNF